VTFFESTAPDITVGLPFSLGAGVAAGFSSVTGWDVSIGGLGFNLRPSPEAPYVRASEGVRKQQLDTSKDAGEQSLTSWWIRSQSDWSSGAGVTWYEPGADEATVSRFTSSHNVDVWTRGQFTLLKLMEAVGTAWSDTVHLSSATVGGVDGYVLVSEGAARWTPSTGSAVTKSLLGVNGTQPAIVGDTAYCGHDSGIDIVDFGASTVTAQWSNSGSVRCWYVKNRLVVAIGPALYQLGLGAAAGAITSVGTVMYTHPSAGWVWTDVAEAGGAILASGYEEGTSGVLAFTVQNDATTGVPEIVGGSQVAIMPPNEQIRCMGVYLGTVLVLGTSRGVRVGSVNTAGDVAYGPLTVETSGVVDVAFRDRFAYCAVTGGLEDGTTGAVRIDLSVTSDEADRRAWAWDVSVPTSGAASSIALVGDRVVLAASLTVYLESATDFAAAGWLKTGRLRYGTVEPKAFRLARVEASIPAGTATMSAITPGGAEVSIISYTSAFVTDTDVTVQIPNENVHQWLQFKLALTSETTSAPTVTGFSVKAAPAPGRVRLYQFPLSLFDFEKDRFGTEYGAPGSAYSRLTALELAEDTAVPVRIVDNRTGESFVGAVDSVEFQAVTAPDRARDNFGGRATVIVRKL
jgi:hypothetical protein